MAIRIKNWAIRQSRCLLRARSSPRPPGRVLWSGREVPATLSFDDCSRVPIMLVKRRLYFG